MVPSATRIQPRREPKAWTSAATSAASPGARRRGPIADTAPAASGSAISSQVAKWLRFTNGPKGRAPASIGSQSP